MADLSAPELGGDDRHHLERVLRLRPGEEVTASDGRGGWRRCRFVGPGPGPGPRLLEPVGDVERVSRPEPAVTVVFALTKGDRPEWTVQKLVEAGVDRIVPMTTGRTVVHWEGEKAWRQVARLRSVAVAAAMQSRQVWLPAVDGVVSFDSVAGLGADLAMAQVGGDPPSLARPTVLIGPEGGWDEAELDAGLPLVALGPAVLRAETAAMAAGVLLCALRAGVVWPAS